MGADGALGLLRGYAAGRERRDLDLRGTARRCLVSVPHFRRQRVESEGRERRPADWHRRSAFARTAGPQAGVVRAGRHRE